MHKSRLTRIGNSTGVILPQDLLGSVGLGRGDDVVMSVDEAGVRTLPKARRREWCSASPPERSTRTH